MVRSGVLAVGLTGGIGSGKSTVATMLVDRGAVLIDADAIVREVQAPDGPAFVGIVERFGSDVVLDDGTLDRARIAAVVFNDSEARTDLNRLTLPHVGTVMAQRMAEQAKTDNVVVLDIPLLAEGGRERYSLAGVLVVDCPPDTAIARAVARGMDEDDVRRRVAVQASRTDRLKVADFVIDNSGDRDQLTTEVAKAWDWIESLRENV